MSLADKDRIFTNLYGQDYWPLAGARRRGDWDGTKTLLAKGRDYCPGIDNWTLKSPAPTLPGEDGKYWTPKPGQYNPFA